MWQESDAVAVGRCDCAEARQVKRLHIRRMESAVDRPFEPSDAREIGRCSGRREAREEFGEPFAIGIEIGAARRLCRDEDAGRALEELGADETVDRRIAELERGGEGAGEVVAVDAEPRFRRQSVGEHIAGGEGVVAPDNATADRPLDLKQPWHRRSFAGHGRATPRRARPRRRGPRAPAGWCPTRSGWGPGQSTPAPRHRVPRPRG